MNSISSILCTNYTNRLDIIGSSSPILLPYDDSSDYVPFYMVNLCTREYNSYSEFSAKTLLQKAIDKLPSGITKSILNHRIQLLDVCDLGTAKKLLLGQLKATVYTNVLSRNNFNVVDNSRSSYFSAGNIFDHINSDSQCINRIKYNHYLYRNNFFMDYTDTKVLYSIVIKKEYLEIVRYCGLLGEEVPLEWFEVWIRQDFIDNLKYKTLFNAFRRIVLSKFTESNLEIKIVKDFSELYSTFKLPVVKSLKAQKEQQKNLSIEFLNYKKGNLIPSLEFDEFEDYDDEDEESEENIQDRIEERIYSEELRREETTDSHPW